MSLACSIISKVRVASGTKSNIEFFSKIMQKNNIALQYRIQEKAMPIQTQRRVQLTDQKRIMRKQYKFSDG